MCLLDGLLSQLHDLVQVVLEGLELQQHVGVHQRERYEGLRLPHLLRLQRQHCAVLEHYVAVGFLVLLHAGMDIGHGFKNGPSRTR